MTTLRRSVLGCFIGLTTLTLVWWFWAVGPSVVLLRIRFGTAPEAAATAFLRALGTHACWASLAALRDKPIDVNEQCMRENSRPALHLRLSGVTQSEGVARLRYKFLDANLSSPSELFVWVRRDKVNWIIQGYARDY